MPSPREPLDPRSVPAPAHPDHRRRPLPWQQPKPAEEDPDAMRRIEAIMSNPSYRQSDRDSEFLERSDMRDVRLMIDYLKPELILKENHVQQTIVVFGSTRIHEPATAAKRVAEFRNMVAETPGDRGLRVQLSIAERILEKSRYYDMAREFGRLVGEAGGGPSDNRLLLTTGGGPGIMEAANRGAFDVDAHSIGLNISLPYEQYPNPYVTPGLSFRFRYFALRKLHFLLRAKALVAFPGGYGTFDELFETLTLIQTRTIKPVPVILVGQEYWSRAVNFDFLVDEGVIDVEDRELFWFAEDAAEIWNGILEWHNANGTPLDLETSGD